MGRINNKEINLNVLFEIIWHKKIFIILLTSCITVLSAIYVFNKIPMYKASALIEIGSYKKENNNILLLDEPSQLVQKLNILYIDLLVNDKDRLSKITNISIPKKSKKFIYVSSLATSNKLAIKEIKKIVLYIQNKHKVLLNNINVKRELELTNVTNKINNMIEVEFREFDKNIEKLKLSIEKYKIELQKLNIIIKEIEKNDPSLTALKLMEKTQILNTLIKLESKLFVIEGKYNNEKINSLPILIENKSKIELLLLEYNNSNIVGDFIINDSPVKPNKKLIITVSCILGFMFSLFVILILQMVKNRRN